jgi:hypothetical protein
MSTHKPTMRDSNPHKNPQNLLSTVTIYYSTMYKWRIDSVTIFCRVIPPKVDGWFVRVKKWSVCHSVKTSTLCNFGHPWLEHFVPFWFWVLLWWNFHHYRDSSMIFLHLKGLSCPLLQFSIGLVYPAMSMVDRSLAQILRKSQWSLLYDVYWLVLMMVNSQRDQNTWTQFRIRIALFSFEQQPKNRWEMKTTTNK